MTDFDKSAFFEDENKVLKVRDIGAAIGEWAVESATANRAYAIKKKYEHAIRLYLAEKYPEEYRRLEQGKQTTFRAEGIQLSRKREYDPNLVRAAFGETHPNVVRTVTEEVADGRVLRPLWSDAAKAQILADTLIPSPITVKVVAE